MTAATVESFEFAGYSPAELRRRLREASVLLSAAETPTREREQVLRRACGHLRGTIRKLERLIGEVAARPDALDDLLTERHDATRIRHSP